MHVSSHKPSNGGRNACFGCTVGIMGRFTFLGENGLRQSGIDFIWCGSREECLNIEDTHWIQMRIHEHIGIPERGEDSMVSPLCPLSTRILNDSRKQTKSGLLIQRKEFISCVIFLRRTEFSLESHSILSCCLIKHKRRSTIFPDSNKSSILFVPGR